MMETVRMAGALTANSCSMPPTESMSIGSRRSSKSSATVTAVRRAVSSRSRSTVRSKMLISMTACTPITSATASVINRVSLVRTESERRSFATLGRVCMVGATVVAVVEFIEVLAPTRLVPL